MNFQTWMTVLYEIATRTLSRVCLRDNPGLVGLVILQMPTELKVHWGYDNKKPVQTWHNTQDLIPFHETMKKEHTNGS